MNEISSEKKKLLEKYNLTLNPDTKKWETYDHYCHSTITYFTDKVVREQSLLWLLFTINKLCYAKIKYFESHLDEWEPKIYDLKKGSIVECELYDMEFIYHKNSKRLIDLRNLQKIHDVRVFRRLCSYLENCNMPDYKEKIDDIDNKEKLLTCKEKEEDIECSTCGNNSNF